MNTDKIFAEQLANEYAPKMAYYLNGITAVVGEWLKNDCRDPVEMMISVIEQCVLAGYYGGKTGCKNSF